MSSQVKIAIIIAIIGAVATITAAIIGILPEISRQDKPSSPEHVVPQISQEGKELIPESTVVQNVRGKLLSHVRVALYTESSMQKGP